MVDFLLRLLAVRSPTGYTAAAVDLVEHELTSLGYHPQRTIKGALLLTLPGKGPGGARALTAHVDTLGAMVREVKDNGRLKITAVGGLEAHAVEGEYCEVRTLDGKAFTGTCVPTKASIHVFGDDYRKLERTLENMEIRLDERVENREQTEALGIRPGDFILFDPRPAYAGGFVKSRYLDDKAAVACLLGALKAMRSGGLQPIVTSHLFISVYEEVGHGNPAGLPQDIEELVAVDMAAVGKGQSSDEYSVTICAKDSSGPYDLGLRERLAKLAKAQKLRYCIDIYPYYGSDASAAMRAGWNIRHGLIGPGVDASHTHERTHQDALENTTRLAVAYLTT
ncbi:MAG: M42 family metallopeptidase [Firmicutes bacterium]|nr:M42 family metallopeptidase [Bacillota bacterium]